MTDVTASKTEVNVDPEERDKFDRIAGSWWDPEGEFKPLHELNPARLRYVSERSVIKESDVLDVGCGGGILSESLAASGGRVTGIDIAEKPLKIAKLHLHESGLKVDYRQITVEALASETPASFDIITCMEMLEHVPDPASVIQACARLLRPGGQVFFSTLSRTPEAFALAIVGAEHVLKLLTKGTHQYDRFIKPSELSAWAREAGLVVNDIKGLHYNPLTRSVRLGGHVRVNYLVHASLPNDQEADL